jgi:hypothetical protein
MFHIPYALALTHPRRVQMLHSSITSNFYMRRSPISLVQRQHLQDSADWHLAHEREKQLTTWCWLQPGWSTISWSYASLSLFSNTSQLPFLKSHRCNWQQLYAPVSVSVSVCTSLSYSVTSLATVFIWSVCVQDVSWSKKTCIKHFHYEKVH